MKTRRRHDKGPFERLLRALRIRVDGPRRVHRELECLVLFAWGPLLVIGVVFGLVKMFTGYAEVWTVVMNLAWSVFSLLILISAVLIARETKQQRHAVRVEAALPVTLYFDSGALVDTETEDASIGGLAVRIPRDMDMADKVVTDVAIRTAGESLVLPVKVAGKSNGVVRLSFADLTFEQRRALSVAVFGRSDAWEDADIKLENAMVKAA